MNSVLNERLAQNSKLKVLYDRVRAIPPVDAGHDFSHTERVAKLCAQIVSDEMIVEFHRAATLAEIDSSIAAGLLHDCIPVPKNSPLRFESARLCSEKAHEWLSEFKWKADEIPIITDAILKHSYSAGLVPESLLGKVLQDADRLEALGALGLFRTIATGVFMGAELFDKTDPWAKKRALDDKRFTIDHFFTKLLKLPETFRTRTAKNEAIRRANYLQAFVVQLKSEI